MDTTVLVVDDSKTYLHLMKGFLTDLGYSNIETAQNVDEAKKQLSEKKIDLILADWHMPGGSGLDLLKYVRATKSLSDLPFLMITTEHEKRNIYEAARAGVQNYIFKPVQKETLKKKLYDLAKTYHTVNPPHEAMT
jgi:two-component system chemotaxis response regulator CheY